MVTVKKQDKCLFKVRLVHFMDMNKEIIVLCSFVYVLGVLNASAQDTTAFNKQVDICIEKSLEDNMKQVDFKKQKPSELEKRNFTDSKFYQMTFVGAPLILTGMIMKGEDTHFRSLRNDYMKSFHRPFDNYTQFLPGAVMLGLKAAGVDSRCSWSRMLVSDAFSVAIMGTVVNTMKNTTHVTRPDGSNNHSFPSGHTATAFMTATMLTKEYGHISLWIGIGAYTIASSTGLMRMANNKHWLSDVLTGAGIGILSTEFGYYIADLLFKDKGVRHLSQDESFNKYDKPTFMGLYLGVNIPLSHYDISENQNFRTSSGSSAGVEGAMFLNPYLGIGGRFTVSNTHIITSEKNGTVSRQSAQDYKTLNGEVAECETFDAVMAMAGPYFSYPITSRWNIGSKLLTGYIAYPKLSLSGGTVVPKNCDVCFGSGISFSYKAKENYGIRFFLDYNLQPSQSKKSREWMNTLAVGTTFGVNL